MQKAQKFYQFLKQHRSSVLSFWLFFFVLSSFTFPELNQRHFGHSEISLQADTPFAQIEMVVQKGEGKVLKEVTVLIPSLITDSEKSAPEFTLKTYSWLPINPGHHYLRLHVCGSLSPPSTVVLV